MVEVRKVNISQLGDFLKQDCLLVVEKPTYVGCPECSEPYLHGDAIILLSLAGKHLFIGQDKNELHQCPHCSEHIRGGFRGETCLVAVFPTVEDAERRAVQLSNLLHEKPHVFQKKIVLVETSGTEGFNFQ